MANRPHSSRRVATLLVAASFALAGCSGASAPRGLSHEQPITGTDPVTVSLVGDVHFEKHLTTVAKDPDGLASLKGYLSKADITVANLETAITDGPGRPQAGKEFTFHSPSSALTTLADAGVDVVGMANNHAGDYDDAGVIDTLRAKKDAPLTIIGIGADVTEAVAPATYTIDGVSVAILNASQLWEQTTRFHTATDTRPGIATITPERKSATETFLAAVKDAATRYDVVIVFLHYGTELTKCPTDKQFAAVNQLSAVGADAVIGGHSHRVQAGGWTGNTYVNFGLGSFTWWKRPADPATGVLTISLDKDRIKAKRALPEDKKSEAKSVVGSEAWQPMEIPASGVPVVPGAAAVEKMTADRQRLMACSKLRADP